MIEKKLQVKQWNHHVWAKYLRRWSVNNKDVYYTTKNNKYIIACDSTKKLCCEKNFYKITALNENHIEIIKWLINQQNFEGLRKYYRRLLNDVLQIHHANFWGERYLLPESTLYKRINAELNNYIENFHTDIENSVFKILKDLSLQDLSVLDNLEHMDSFMRYIGHQFARTKTFKELCNMANKNLNEHSKNFEECWWFLAIIFGENIGADCFFERHTANHSLLINNTTIPFITSDQPVINVYSQLDNSIIEQRLDHELDLYYPISPTVAYMISYSKRFDKGIVDITEDIADEMNIKIARFSHEHIIGDSKESLLKYRKYVGNRIERVTQHSFI